MLSTDDLSAGHCRTQVGVACPWQDGLL